MNNIESDPNCLINVRNIFEERNVVRNEEIICIIICINYSDIYRRMPKLGRIISFYKQSTSYTF